MDGSAAAIIAKLGLEPHPEGGWYRETWRAEAAPGTRASATAIHFLLDAGERSHWHRVDAAEIWLWHAGGPLTLSIAPDANGPVRQITLGGDVLAGEEPQALVPPGQWQAAAPVDGWVLVSCVVSPGFDFAGFELAPEGWVPAG
ncbi:cupin domain-containing protein [Novosphingobium sp. JCM 18896]|uniref:cupin domain-containing protein n=1 Tax=Novosphingobium sp. JCM 18896 TaxID=2989731 RepID=UPI00222229B9|nr:cupin domain-containing protein [Novosphingobium sp. JCM 18896]MCW1430354.1 cupin domain-containing protein [Novosphingobium sp. JCM 18896]